MNSQQRKPHPRNVTIFRNLGDLFGGLLQLFTTVVAEINKALSKRRKPKSS